MTEQVMQLVSDFAPRSRAELYHARLSAGDDTATRAKYKRIIEKEFDVYGNVRVSVARNAVLDYQKVAGSGEGVADVMVFYVESGAALAADVGDDVESFYSSLGAMWRKAMLHIQKHDLQPLFRDRCERVVHVAQGCGYGLDEMLGSGYGDVFEDPDEDQADR